MFDVGGGGLESVEGDGGEAGLERAVEGGLDDLGDRHLDGIVVFEEGYAELARGGPMGVMEVAEGSVPEGG